MVYVFLKGWYMYFWKKLLKKLVFGEKKTDDKKHEEFKNEKS